MSGNRNTADSEHSGRIDINDTYEMRDWCTALSCSEEQLENAVRAVGNSAVAVKRYLKKYH